MGGSSPILGCSYHFVVQRLVIYCSQSKGKRIIFFNNCFLGFMEDAVDLLEAHSQHVPEDFNNPYTRVGDLIRSMPRFFRGWLFFHLLPSSSFLLLFFLSFFFLIFYIIGYRHSKADWRRWQDSCGDLMVWI